MFPPFPFSVPNLSLLVGIELFLDCRQSDQEEPHNGEKCSSPRHLDYELDDILDGTLGVSSVGKRKVSHVHLDIWVAKQVVCGRDCSLAVPNTNSLLPL